jgi:hypothetical protein
MINLHFQQNFIATTTSFISRFIPKYVQLQLEVILSKTRKCYFCYRQPFLTAHLSSCSIISGEKNVENKKKKCRK